MVCGENDLVCPGCLFQAGQRHGLLRVESGEKRLELRLIRVVGDIPGVQRFKAQGAPGLFSRFEVARMKLVVQEAALTAHEVGMEIIRLQAVDRRGAFAYTPISKFEQRHTGGGIFIW